MVLYVAPFWHIDFFDTLCYNTVRIHSHCGYLSPNEYEKKYNRELDQMEKQAV